jgi:CRP-like cAMP-binding protein
MSSSRKVQREWSRVRATAHGEARSLPSASDAPLPSPPSFRRRSLARAVPSSMNSTADDFVGGAHARFAQLDAQLEQEVADDSDDGDEDDGERQRLRQEQFNNTKALRTLKESEFEKRGGGTRKLTLKEQLLLRSLLRRPDQRSEDDVQLLVRATAEVKFFQTLTPTQHAELCRDMSHEVVPAHTTIYTQDEDGSSFYILYLGCCKMFATDAKQGWDNKCIAVLEDGASFGDLALLGNGKRAATVKTSTQTILFKIEKRSYERTLQQEQSKDLSLIIKFLRSVFIFSDFTEDELRRVAASMVRRKYRLGTTIIAQGDHADTFYFLLSGRVRVLKRTRMPAEQVQLLEGKERSPPRRDRSPKKLARSPTRPERSSSKLYSKPSPAALRVLNREQPDRSGVESEREAAAAAAAAILSPSGLTRLNIQQGDVLGAGGRRGSRGRRGSISSVNSFNGDAKRDGRRPSLRRCSISSLTSLTSIGTQGSMKAMGFVPAAGESVMLEIAEMGPHEYFGELGLLLRRSHTCSVVTNSAVEVLALTPRDFYLYIEPRCGSMMRSYARRYYVDNWRQENNIAGICQAISRSTQWTSYKQRVVEDAKSGRALISTQPDALDRDVLERTGEGIEGSRFLTGGIRARSQAPAAGPASPPVPAPVVPASQSARASPRRKKVSPYASPRPQPASTQNTPRLFDNAPGPRGGGSERSSPRSRTDPLPRRTRVQPKYSLRGAGMVPSQRQKDQVLIDSDGYTLAMSVV